MIYIYIYIIFIRITKCLVSDLHFVTNKTQLTFHMFTCEGWRILVWQRPRGEGVSWPPVYIGCGPFGDNLGAVLSSRHGHVVIECILD